MLVIGIGNEFRQDDGVGIVVARQVKAAARPGVEVYERSGEGTDLIAAWEGRDTVIVIDAVASGAADGTVHRFVIDAHGADETAPFPSSRIFRGTSHQVGLGEGIELARLLGQLPRRLIVYGIESRAFGEGVGLTAPVAAAGAQVAARILADLSRD